MAVVYRHLVASPAFPYSTRAVPPFDPDPAVPAELDAGATKELAGFGYMPIRSRNSRVRRRESVTSRPSSSAAISLPPGQG